MANMQYIDGRMLLGEDITPNQKYSKIINKKIVKAPFENNNYQKEFTRGKNETSDKYNIFLDTRDGLESATFVEYDLGFSDDYREIDITSLIDGGTITDSVFLDGDRYLMRVSQDEEYMKIFKQEFFNEPNVCGNYEDEPVTTGRFVNISFYQGQKDDLGVSYPVQAFPFNKCLHNKFTKALGPKGQSVKQGNHGVIKNQLVGNEIVTYFYDQNEEIVDVEPGDFVCLYDGDFSTQILGVSASNITVNGHSGVLMEGPFGGFNSIQVPVSQNVLDNQGDLIQTISSNTDTVEVSMPHKRKIFKNRGDILHFVTSDGIFMLNHFDETEPVGTNRRLEITYEGNTYRWTNWNVNPPLFTISSLINKDESLVFIDQKQGVVYHGLSGYQKAYFDPRNSYEIGGDYNQMALVSGYVIFMGRERVVMMNTQFISPQFVTFGGEIAIDRDIGCMNRYSFHSNGSILFWVGEDGKYRKTVIETYGQNAIVPKTEIQFCAYQSDLDVFRRDIDTIRVGRDGLREYIFCIVGAHTIVMVKDIFRVKWIYPNRKLYGIHANAMRGNGIYEINGDTDNGQEIQSLVQMTLGEFDYHIMKHVYSAKLSLGYNSNITKGNTAIRCEFDADGWNGRFTYSDLHNAEYVRHIMKLKDNVFHTENIEEFPVDINIRADNGHTKSQKKVRNMEDDVREFFGYTSNLNIEKTDSIITDSNSVKTFDVSKFGVVEIPLNVEGNVVHISIVSKGGDNVEFGGFFVMYEPRDISSTRMSNVLTVSDRKKRLAK